MITLRELAEIVGPHNVSEHPAALAEYAGDMSFVAAMSPRFIVSVDGVAALQGLMDLARKTKTGLIPVSSGPPHFYGDTVPSTGDAVIVDLGRLKKIDLVDREERVASVVGAGVTFGELSAAVAEKGLRLNSPLAPRASKSVVGSMLSREPVIMPHYHWDIGDPMGSMEVVFGTGDVFRTGAAAGPGSIEEQRIAGGVQKEAAGPSANSFHRLLQASQGTMGIVTWASVRCELAPKLERPYFVGADNPRDVLEAAYWLLRLRLANELVVLNAVDVAAIVGRGGVPVRPLPEWVLFFNLAAYDYLSEMRIEGQEKDVVELMRGLGHKISPSLGGISAGEFLETVRRPSEEPYWKLRQGGGVQDIFYLTTWSKIPEQISLMSGLCGAAGYPANKLGIYLQPTVQGTSCHVEFALFYDVTDQDESRAVRQLATSVIAPLTSSGAFFSRPFGEAAANIMSRDTASMEALKKIKAIVDPDGILNPGKLCF